MKECYLFHMSIKKYINESTFKTYKYFVKRYELIPTPNIMSAVLSECHYFAIVL